MNHEDLKKELELFTSREVADQTLLSWIQAGLTLIGFGFALGSIIAVLRSEHYEKVIIKTIRVIAELLIFVGIVSIVWALIQHRHKVNALKSREYRYKSLFNLSLFIGVMVAVLGAIAFIAILVHIFV